MHIAYSSDEWIHSSNILFVFSVVVVVVGWLLFVSANSFYVTVVVQLKTATKRAGVYVVCNTVGYFASHKHEI